MASLISENEEQFELESRMALTAAVMADKSRSRMLSALMDGRAWTATELSAVADVSASTASAHLARLCEQRFVISLAQGRHRYFRLASTEIAQLLERLMGVAWASSATRKITTPPGLRHARTCYDHLAGEIAVMLFDTLVSRQWVTAQGDALTPLGQAKLTELGIEIGAGVSRRKLSCGCLDWSERRYHTGGVLGAALLTWFEQQRWITTTAGSRQVTFTQLGIRKLQLHFGITALR
ncbi:winged helix-turn-helix domain-containing protein [Citrobacter sp. Awk 4]|uniref:ArsR/SmtB family transcription factor n=1 Tax=Citrobacter sp. Awk 4 TaxID=2963955 RepID=UPI0023025B6F|nr:winged helix-turn-helix domain-containing protein [Citrobacter sp. Awk 4]MDA8480557.1 winged helix-turn-helix domain-containing protein [Citrobacter sp. Awk 4]